MLSKLMSKLKTDLTPLELLVRGSYLLTTKKLNHLEEKIMAMLEELKKEVAATKDVVSSAIVLINGFKDKLEKCGTDEAALKELKDSLSEDVKKLADAVVANTPAETPPVTDIPPAEPNP